MNSLWSLATPSLIGSEFKSDRGRNEQASQLPFSAQSIVASSLIGSEFNSDRGRKEQAPQVLFMREVEDGTPYNHIHGMM